MFCVITNLCDNCNGQEATYNVSKRIKLYFARVSQPAMLITLNTPIPCQGGIRVLVQYFVRGPMSDIFLLAYMTNERKLYIFIKRYT